MKNKTIVVWFRQDLRLHDHPALKQAIQDADDVLPLYIYDEAALGDWPHGGASKWWLHHSLSALAKELEDRYACPLVLRRGGAREVLLGLCEEVGAEGVYVSRMYEPAAIAQEKSLHEALADVDLTFRRFSGSLLIEPEHVQTKTGGPYKVYTPFWRAVSSAGPARKVMARPKKISAPSQKIPSDNLASWDLLPTKPNWAKGFPDWWQPGEAHAQKRLKTFLAGAVKDYHVMRDRPDVNGTSRLSPHLHFGEISPTAIWSATVSNQAKTVADRGSETFLKEVVWREFSTHLLFHFPHLPSQPFRPEFKNFPWTKDKTALRAWQRGQTGYPIVDAGMRELWATGWMHNRVRMIVASFLIKHLRLAWQSGEEWFWDTLLDADLANNAAGWQWVAGSGADASPYFRIFNPITQGQKFDVDGKYVSQWVPEIEKVPLKFIHAPWTAPESVLSEAGVVLGKTYPLPIVDHAEARKAALAGYDKVKGA